MTLSDFATFSTAISGLAVTASLIYLALQTHQSAKHTKALIHQGRASRIVELAMAATRSDLVEAAIAANGEEPTHEEIRRRNFEAFVVHSSLALKNRFSSIEMACWRRRSTILCARTSLIG